MGHLAMGKAQQRRNAEVMLIDTVMRWRRDIVALCPEQLERLREIAGPRARSPGTAHRARVRGKCDQYPLTLEPKRGS